MPRHAAIDRKVEQALDEMEQRRLRTAGVIVPFKRCPAPDCDHGWIHHFDAEHASRWWTPCQVCGGTGRVLIQLEPGFVTRFRNWWKANREPVSACFNFVWLCLIGAALFYICGWIRAIAGLLEWRP